MDCASAHTLCQLTSDFYRQCAHSFSDTRRAPWDGWRIFVDTIGFAKGLGSCDVLDIGCGNLRFERFLASEFPQRILSSYAVDDCGELVACAAGDRGMTDVRFQRLDVIEMLVDGCDLALELEAPPCDLSVAFGFMHHVPGFGARVRLLEALCAKTKPGGYVALSLWSFMDDARMVRKAREKTQEALGAYPRLSLDDNDYLLGWKHDADVYRYCHHFTSEEADALVSSVAGETCLIGDYAADSTRSGSFNRYLVFRRT